jgi:hypothetical protein
VIPAQNQELVFWHGGQWKEGPPDIVKQKGGSVEHGPGIYLTSSHERASKYAKGGGVVRRVVMSPETRWLDEAAPLPLRSYLPLVASLRCSSAVRGRVLDDLKRASERAGSRGIESGFVHPAVLNTLSVNHRIAHGENGLRICQFMRDEAAVDADMFFASDPEVWVVVFNPDAIVSSKIVRATKDSPEDTHPAARKNNPVGLVLDSDPANGQARGRLILGKEERLMVAVQQPAISSFLRGMKRMRRRVDNTMNGALEMAGFAAKQFNETVYVYKGNSYGHEVWRAVLKLSEAASFAGNGTGRILVVTPDLDVWLWWQVTGYIDQGES